MSQQTITVIPGDGIGPDIVEATLKVLDKAGCKFQYRFADAGLAALEKHGELLPPATLELIKSADATLKGPLTTPIGEGFGSINVSLRKTFELYANVRPVLSLEGTQSRYDNVDIITVRENTEGMYCGAGQIVSENGDNAEAKSIITREGAERICTFAYDLARKEGRKKVTAVHKANILKSTSGLFLNVAREVGERYPDIESEEMIVDANLHAFGNEPGALRRYRYHQSIRGYIVRPLRWFSWWIGHGPRCQHWQECRHYLKPFMAVPPISPGQDLCQSPTALILGAIQMLEYLAMPEQAAKIRKAITETIAEGICVTRDLGGNAGTKAFTDAILAKL